jgi:hypothetical protein
VVQKNKFQSHKSKNKNKFEGKGKFDGNNKASQTTNFKKKTKVLLVILRRRISVSLGS